MKLLENNFLSVHAAKVALKKNQFMNILHKGKFLNLIASHEPEFVEAHKEEYDAYFKALVESLSQPQTT
jgi:hypothetical protein